MSSIVLAENFISSKKAEYIRFAEQLGSNVCFLEDKWRCDKLRRAPAEDFGSFTLYFSKVPDQYKEMVKYFSIIRIIQGLTIGSAKVDVVGLTKFFDFWTAKYKSVGLHKCDEFIAAKFCQHLEEQKLAESTKHLTWGSTRVFFQTMNGWDDTPLKNPFSISPFCRQTKVDDKYIPESVILQLDGIFKQDEIALHLRCAYWLIRLIPSRISEVLGTNIDCLKRYNGNYVLFIPTWKQNGGRREPIMRSIHLEETGIAGYLIYIIKQQQEVARQLQKHMTGHKKGALLAYRKSHVYKGVSSDTNYCTVLAIYSMWSALRSICVKYHVANNDGQIYKVTSHQFRHNGITDRLAAGFTTAQIAEMTDHHGSAMILNSYNHLNLLPETIIEKQEYVLQEENGRENRYVLFGGRILNMEEQLERRLLRNLRAHKVRGGICCDITGCKSDMWNCLECESFAPDADQLEYYVEQAVLWREKCVRFKKFPIIKGNAERNVELFERVLIKLKEGVHVR